ncbi:MAG: hypothetical protein F9K38_02950 [Pseudorhodoplanes sp.]|nr:MAG: hypothetical protein F9K38_02950 [Pseudorhodoplanes sp.]
MDSSFTIKPRDGTNRVLYDRGSVARTELSPTRTVSATNPALPMREPPGSPDSLPRSRAMNPQSEGALLRAREEEDRRKRRRASDKALSRMRAYTQPATSDEGDPHGPHADIQI